MSDQQPNQQLNQQFNPLRSIPSAKPRPEDTDDTRLAEILEIHENGEKLDAAFAKMNENTFVIWGYADDRGVDRNKGRIGASEGPDAIRQYLYNFVMPSSSLRKSWKIIDLGNLRSWSLTLTEAHKTARNFISRVRATGARIVTLGGGHDWAFSDFADFPTSFQEERKHLINFDSHLDMRPTSNDPENAEHSGSAFRSILEGNEFLNKNLRLSVVGLQRHCNAPTHLQWAEGQRVGMLFLEDLSLGAQEQWQEITEKLDLEKPPSSPESSDVFAISVDMDCFSQAFAPGVSAPQPYGLDPRILQKVLLKLGKKTRQMGIYECCPKYDLDGKTSRLAARMIFDFIYSHVT
jgi:formiminoglutamase